MPLLHKPRRRALKARRRDYNDYDPPPARRRYVSSPGSVRTDAAVNPPKTVQQPPPEPVKTAYERLMAEDEY
jgi:hypothetical protein